MSKRCSRRCAACTTGARVVVEACERSALAELARVDDDESGGDTIYAVDRVSGNA